MTIYLLSKRYKWKPTNDDLKRLGVAVSLSAKARGIGFSLIQQSENGTDFKVNDYPDSFIPQMVVILKRYWKKREKLTH